MRIECDSDTVSCFGWTFGMILVLTVGSIIGLSIYEYRRERRYAIEHGLVPHRVIVV